MNCLYSKTSFIDDVDEDHTSNVFFTTDQNNNDDGKIIVDDQAIYDRYSVKSIDVLGDHVARIFPNKDESFYSSFKKWFLAKKREDDDETPPDDVENNIRSFLNSMKIKLAFRKLPFKKKQICDFFDTTDDVEILEILTDFEEWFNKEEEPTGGYWHDFKNWGPYSKIQRKIIEDLKINSTTRKGETVEYTVVSKHNIEIQGKFQIYDGDDQEIIDSLKQFENIKVTKKQIEEARKKMDGKTLNLILNAPNAYVLKMKRFQCLIQPNDKCKVMDIDGWKLSQKFRQQFGKKLSCVSGLNDKKEKVKPVEENKKDEEDLTDTDEDTEGEDSSPPPVIQSSFLFTRPRKEGEGYNTTQVKKKRKRKRKRKIKAKKRRRVRAKPIKRIQHSRNQKYNTSRYENDFTYESLDQLISEMESEDNYGGVVWTVKSFEDDKVILVDEEGKDTKTCLRSVLRPDNDDTFENVLKRKKLDALLCLIDPNMTNRNACNDIWKYVEDDVEKPPQIINNDDVVEKVCSYCGCRKLKNREKNPLFRKVKWNKGEFYLCNAHAVQYMRNNKNYQHNYIVNIDDKLKNMEQCGPQETPIAPDKNTEYEFVAMQKKLRLKSFVECILKGENPPVTVDMSDIWIQNCLTKMKLEPEIRKYTPEKKKKKKKVAKKDMSLIGIFMVNAKKEKKEPEWIMDRIRQFSIGTIGLNEFLKIN